MNRAGQTPRMELTGFFAHELRIWHGRCSETTCRALAVFWWTGTSFGKRVWGRSLFLKSVFLLDRIWSGGRTFCHKSSWKTNAGVVSWLSFSWFGDGCFHLERTVSNQYSCAFLSSTGCTDHRDILGSFDGTEYQAGADWRNFNRRRFCGDLLHPDSPADYFIWAGKGGKGWH